jgi:hypothetical protein
MPVLNGHLIQQIYHHPAKSDGKSSPESFSDTENWFYWIWDWNNPNDSNDNWEGDNQSEMELGNRREDSETLEWGIGSA